MVEKGASLRSNKVSRADIPKIEVFDNDQIRKSIGGGIRNNAQRKSRAALVKQRRTHDTLPVEGNYNIVTPTKNLLFK